MYLIQSKNTHIEEQYMSKKLVRTCMLDDHDTEEGRLQRFQKEFIVEQR